MSNCSDCNYKDCYNCPKSLKDKPIEEQKYIQTFIEKYQALAGDPYCQNCQSMDCYACGHMK